MKKHHRAKLTAEQVAYARILAKIGPYGTVAQLAKHWGINAQTLRQTILYKSWQWLPPPTQEELDSTPLPDWLDTAGRSRPKPLCGLCVHWSADHGCGLQLPEAGGYFAQSCAAYVVAGLKD